MRAVGYCRTSTGRQELGLEAQERAIRKWCRGKRWELVYVFRDQESGKSMDRPGLQAALRMLDEEGAGALVVTKLDRLGRSVVGLYDLLQSRFIEDGCKLVAVNESLDTSCAAGRAMIGMLAVFSQMERELISERTKAGLEVARSKGRPLGARRLFTGAKLAAEVRAVRKLRKDGYSYRQIAKLKGYSAMTARKYAKGAE